VRRMLGGARSVARAVGPHTGRVSRVRAEPDVPRTLQPSGRAQRRVLARAKESSFKGHQYSEATPADPRRSDDARGGEPLAKPRLLVRA
jgi:hypothetical protein